MPKEMPLHDHITLDRCIEALVEKDRFSYLGRFIQGFIHNVNGPLQNMSMLVEMMLRGQETQDNLVRTHVHDSIEEWDGLSEKQQKRFRQLAQQIDTLAEMLRDFMVLHDIEQTETGIDLNLALAKLAKVFRADLFFKHQVSLELQLTPNLPMVRIPGRHLVPALTQLLQNAITAVREAPQKRLTIESRMDGETILVLFKDSGCGFKDSTSRESLFDLFRSDWPVVHDTDRGRKEHHLGFGLYAARRLLEPYGVKIRLERGGEETHAILEIPLSP